MDLVRLSSQSGHWESVPAWLSPWVRDTYLEGSSVRDVLGRLVGRARPNGDSFILECKARVPLRIAADGTLLEVITDAAGLRLAAHGNVGDGTLYGITTSNLVEPDDDTEPRCKPVETSDADAEAVLDLLGRPPPGHVPGDVVWLARRRRQPVAAVGFYAERGHWALAWLVAESSDDGVALITAALAEAWLLRDVLTASARTSKAPARLLERVGFIALP